jgi:hypothetical protein
MHDGEGGGAGAAQQQLLLTQMMGGAPRTLPLPFLCSQVGVGVVGWAWASGVGVGTPFVGASLLLMILRPVLTCLPRGPPMAAQATQFSQPLKYPDHDQVRCSSRRR